MKADHNYNSHHHDQKSDTKETGLTCPVMMGVPVDKEEAEKAGWIREYKGKKYYFCCDGCVTDFEVNPENYAK